MIKLLQKVSAVLKGKGYGAYSIAPDAAVIEAIRAMSEKHVGALVVLSAEGRLVGIVSERDYARKMILCGRSSKDTRVEEIMTSPVITVAPDDTVEDCMGIMTEHRLRHLPVVDRGSVVGMISIGDTVKWMVSEQDALIHQLENYITGKYPA